MLPVWLDGLVIDLAADEEDVAGRWWDGGCVDFCGIQAPGVVLMDEIGSV